MQKNYSQTNPKIFEYVEEVFCPEDAVLKKIRAISQSHDLPNIQVGLLDGLHLEVLVRGFNAKKVVEVGTLGGYSATCIVRGLAPGGHLYTCEIDPPHLAAAKESFKMAGIEGQVTLLEGPALDTLPSIEKHAPFDLVFLDADKTNYPNYLEWAYKNLRTGGALIADNTFAFGYIADRKIDDPQTLAAVLALKLYNQRVARDGRFRSTILPTGEGMTISIKL